MLSINNLIKHLPSTCFVWLRSCLVFTNHVFSQVFSNPISQKINQTAIELMLSEVTKGFTAPLDGAIAPLEELQEQLFIIAQIGIIWRVNLLDGEKTVFINVQHRLVKLGAFSSGGYDERGLLGFVFHPNYPKNGLVYLYTSEPTTKKPDFTTLVKPQKPNHQSVLLELKISNQSSLINIAEIKSERELLRIDQPQYNHNGGSLAFDSNGLLYIGVGDGGSSDDQGIGHSK